MNGTPVTPFARLRLVRAHGVGILIAREHLARPCLVKAGARRCGHQSVGVTEVQLAREVPALECAQHGEAEPGLFLCGRDEAVRVEGVGGEAVRRVREPLFARHLGDARVHGDDLVGLRPYLRASMSSTFYGVSVVGVELEGVGDDRHAASPASCGGRLLEAGLAHVAPGAHDVCPHVDLKLR